MATVEILVNVGSCRQTLQDRELIALGRGFSRAGRATGDAVRSAMPATMRSITAEVDPDRPCCSASAKARSPRRSRSSATMRASLAAAVGSKGKASTAPAASRAP